MDDPLRTELCLLERGIVTSRLRARDLRMAIFCLRERLVWQPDILESATKGRSDLSFRLGLDALLWTWFTQRAIAWDVDNSLYSRASAS